MTTDIQTPDSNEEAHWFYAVDEHQFGPQLKATIIAKIKAGEIPRTAKVWCKGMPKWRRIDQTEYAESFSEELPPPLNRAEHSFPDLTGIKNELHRRMGRLKPVTEKNRRLIVLGSIAACLFLFIVMDFLVLPYLEKAQWERDAPKRRLEDEKTRARSQAWERGKGQKAGWQMAEVAHLNAAPIPAMYELRVEAQEVWADPKKFDIRYEGESFYSHYKDRDNNSKRELTAFDEALKQSYIDGFAEGYEAYYRQFRRAF